MGASQGETTAIRVRSSFQRSFEAGETVFDEGDTGDRLYVIQSGEVELVREGVGASRVVARVGPGDFFGELGVVLGRPCTTRAVAVRATRVLELDRETLESMCLEQPAIAIRLLRVVVSRLIEAETRLAALGVDDLLKPVVRGLVRRSEPDPKNGIRIPTSLRRLSEDAGLSMFETHRALHHLIDRKVIRLVDDCLYAADVDTLTASIDATE